MSKLDLRKELKRFYSAKKKPENIKTIIRQPVEK